jgi:hypothetical protein
MDLSKEFLYQQYVVLNKSTRQIARELGCSREPIRLALKRFGFEMGTTKSKLTGIKLSEERCRILSEAHKGLRLAEKHPLYKGEAVGYAALHIWIRSRKPQPAKCEMCGEETDKLDLANISQKYIRETSDWEYLCRKCHMIKDGRLKRLHKRRK